MAEARREFRHGGIGRGGPQACTRHRRLEQDQRAPVRLEPPRPRPEVPVHPLLSPHRLRRPDRDRRTAADHRTRDGPARIPARRDATYSPPRGSPSRTDRRRWPGVGCCRVFEAHQKYDSCVNLNTVDCQFGSGVVMRLVCLEDSATPYAKASLLPVGFVPTGTRVGAAPIQVVFAQFDESVKG